MYYLSRINKTPEKLNSQITKASIHIFVVCCRIEDRKYNWLPDSDSIARFQIINNFQVVLYINSRKTQFCIEHIVVVLNYRTIERCKKNAQNTI